VSAPVILMRHQEPQPLADLKRPRNEAPSPKWNVLKSLNLPEYIPGSLSLE
jgi:hypothetical protein